MKKLTVLLFSCLAAISVAAEQVTLEGKPYEMNRLIERKIGPGTTYIRLRLPDIPLNANLVMVDLNNQYNRIETTTAQELANKVEQLTTAAKRLDAPNHHALAAANANFWIVGTQKEYPLYKTITRNANVRNGKMVTESNQNKEKWDKGTGRTGVVSVSYDKVLNIDYCTSEIKAKIPGKTLNIRQCNKGIRDGEYGMYNSFYGTDRAFMAIKEVTKDAKGENGYVLDDNANVTECLLDLAPDQTWTGGKDIKFIVKEVRKNAGKGTLGNHDLCIMGSGTTPVSNLNLPVGTEVTLNYNWTYDGNIKPIVEQAIGGNAMILRHGEVTEHCTNEAYNSSTYARTAYGCSQDGKTLYILVIDKSTDPVYGKSGGCNTIKMAELANYFGCYNMSHFDGGGSAELMVGNKIVNKTTETSPRSVANGWMVFSTAPDDQKTITSIAFDHTNLDFPFGAEFTPTILGYDKFDNLVNENLTGYTLTCDPEIGTCNGNKFIAGTKASHGLLTATYNGISVSKTILVGGGGASVKELTTDATGLVKCPGVVSTDQIFTITSSGADLKKVCIYSSNGMLVNQLNVNANEVEVNAPGVGGIYIATILRADGVTATVKMLVH